MSSITLPSLNIECTSWTAPPSLVDRSELYDICEDGTIIFKRHDIYFDNPTLSNAKIRVGNNSVIIVGNSCTIRGRFNNNGKWNKIAAGNFLKADIFDCCTVESGNSSTIWCTGSICNIKVGNRSTIYHCANSNVCCGEKGLVVFNSGEHFNFVPPANLCIHVDCSENWTTKVSDFAKWSNKTPEELLYMNIKFGDLISRESINSEFGLNI